MTRLIGFDKLCNEPEGSLLKNTKGSLVITVYLAGSY